jgi:HSP20 family protein
MGLAVDVSHWRSRLLTLPGASPYNETSTDRFFGSPRKRKSMTRFDDEESFLPTFRGEVDAFFREALGPSLRRGVEVDPWNPRLDVSEEEDRFLLEADLPGVRREDITIEVQGRSLIVAGQRKIVRRTNRAGYSHCERLSGSFRRTIPLPRAVDEERITATLEDGILRLELPKKGVSP